EPVGREQADEDEPDPDHGQPEVPGQPPRHSAQPATVAAAVELARRPRLDDWRCCGFRHVNDGHTGPAAGASGSVPKTPLISGTGPLEHRPGVRSGSISGSDQGRPDCRPDASPVTMDA